jgi:hypothetical protein
MNFIKDKKYTGNPKESDCCPEATVGLNQRTVSCPQDRLRIGGPNRRLSFSPILYNSRRQLRLQLQSTTPILLHSTEPTTDYRGRSAPTTSTSTTTTTTTAVTKVFAFRAKNFEKYHFKNCYTVQEFQLLSTPSTSYHS